MRLKLSGLDSTRVLASSVEIPAAPWSLPSGVGDELAYPVGEFEFGVIRLTQDPETAHALTLRRKKS